MPCHHRGESIQGAIGPVITNHFFKIRLASDTILHLAFSTTSSAAGLQVARLPDGESNGSIDSSCVLSTSSTLVTNPVKLDLALEAGSYLIRVYNFFNDADDYLLELSSGSRSQAIVVLGSDPGERSEADGSAGYSAATAPVQRSGAPISGTSNDVQPAPATGQVVTLAPDGAMGP